MDAPPLQAAIKELHVALDAQEDRLRVLSPALAEHLSKVRGGIDKALQNTASGLEEVQRTTSAARSQVVALEELLTRGTGDAEQLQARIGELEAEVEKKTVLVSVLETRAPDLEKQLGDAKASSDAAREHAERLEQDLKAAQARTQELQQRIGELEGELDKRNKLGEGSQKEAAQLNAANEALQEELAALRGEIKELESARDGAVSALSAAKQDAESLRGKVMASADNREQEEQALAEARAAVERLERERLDLQARIEAGPKAEDLGELRTKLEAERDRAELAEQRLRDEMSKGTKSVLAQQLAEALRETEETREELNKAKLELDHLRRDKFSAPSISDEQRVLDAASQHRNGPKRALGEMLADAGVITREQLDQALDEQKKNPTRHLGEILVARKFASDAAVSQAMACQCGVEFVRFKENTVDPEAAALISERLANQHVCIPVSATEDSLVLAIANPMDLVGIEDVERATNRKVAVLVGTAQEIKAAIGRYYWEPE
jgi:predicted  nucleic acid-binding Zn-ribbon protein